MSVTSCTFSLPTPTFSDRPNLVRGGQTIILSIGPVVVQFLLFDVKLGSSIPHSWLFFHLIVGAFAQTAPSPLLRSSTSCHDQVPSVGGVVSPALRSYGIYIYIYEFKNVYYTQAVCINCILYFRVQYFFKLYFTAERSPIFHYSINDQLLSWLLIIIKFGWLNHHLPITCLKKLCVEHTQLMGSFESIDFCKTQHDIIMLHRQLRSNTTLNHTLNLIFESCRGKGLVKPHPIIIL